MKSTVVRASMFLILPLFLLTMFPVTARADTGPKPSLYIICKNMPSGDVYLDLLINEPPLEAGQGFFFGKFGSDSKSNASKYNSDMLTALRSYDADGWRPALTTGTATPIWGDIGLTVKDGEAEANFSYFGVPKQFKIIVVSEDCKIVVSNIVDRKAFQSTVDFDYAKAAANELGGTSEEKSQNNFNETHGVPSPGEVSAAERPPLTETVKQFAFTFPTTLAIEGLILLLFRFSLKQNWKVFLFTNLGTQLALTGVLWLMFGSYSMFAAVLVYVLFEIVIVITESTLYAFLLKQHSVLRRILYGITANVASFFAGTLIFTFTNFYI